MNVYSGGTDTAGEAQFSTDGAVSGLIGDNTNEKNCNRVRMYITNDTKYAQNNWLQAEVSPSGTSVTITLGFYVASGGTVDFGTNISYMQLWEVQA